MKKILTLFLAGALIGAFCVALTACNGEPGQTRTPEEPEESELPEGASVDPVSVSDDVAAFFTEYLNLIVIPISKDRNLWGKGDFCTMINSMEELPKVDNSGNPFEYPVIDFNSHTLILGAFLEGDSGWHLTRQSVSVGSEKTTMNIYVERSENTSGFAVPSFFPFWGLYPKLSGKPIECVRK